MKTLLFSLLLSVLLACESRQPQTSDDHPERQYQITEDIHKPLDEAKGVEQMLQDQADQQRQQVDGM